MPYSTRDLGGLREAMRETRVMFPSGNFSEMMQREQHERIHQYTISEEHCHLCDEYKTMPQACRCSNVCCPKVDAAYIKLQGTGSYCSSCGMNGSRSLGQEACYHCGQEKTFLYLEESK